MPHSLPTNQKIFQYQDNSLPLASGKWFPIVIALIMAESITEADKIFDKLEGKPPNKCPQVACCVVKSIIMFVDEEGIELDEWDGKAENILPDLDLSPFII